jgi:DNA repair photolyase
MMHITAVQCRSILTRSKIPGIDFGINPYIGCAHKCQYCYAVFMKKFSGHTEPWGDFVDVKTNAPEVLGLQLQRMKKKAVINFGTVCDAYQPIETRYKITQRCLKALIPYRHAVSILTKSDLVMRDIDILEALHDIEIGFTITTVDNSIKRIFEPRTPPASKIFKAIRLLAHRNIPVWVFVAPVLPGLTDHPAAIIELIRSSQDAGARYIMFDTLNPYPKVWRNVKRLVSRHFPAAQDRMKCFEQDPRTQKSELKNIITRAALDHLIPCKIAFGCG